MSLTALVPITREEPRVSPEELPKSEAQAGAGCWQQSARLWRWKEGRNAPLCHALPRLSPRSPCCSSHSPCSAHPAPLAAYAPGLQELCHRQPAHLALKDTRTRQGEQSFRSRWMMSSTMQLAAAEVASIAACSSYGITFFGVLLKNISYLLHFVQGNLEYFLLSA